MSAAAAATPSVRRNVAWTLGGNLLYAASQWGILVVLAKLGDAAMVGQFALGLAIGAPVFLFTNLQLRWLQATDSRHEYHFRDYLGLRLAGSLLAMATIVAIALAMPYSRQTGLVVVAVGAAKFFETLSDMVWGLLQKHDLMQRVATNTVAKGVGGLAALTCTLLATGSIVAASFAFAAWWMTSFLLFDIRAARFALHLSGGAPEIWPRFEFATAKSLALVGFPLGVVTLLNSLSLNIPRYVLEAHAGPEALGRFAAMAYFMLAGHLAVSSVANSITGLFGRLWHEDLPRFRTMLLRASAFAVAVGLGLFAVTLVMGEFLLSVIYTPEYAAESRVFQVLMFGTMFQYLFGVLNAGLAVTRRFWGYAIAYAAAPIAAFLFSILLVPRYGTLGAAYASVVSGFAGAVASGATMFVMFRQRERALVEMATQRS